MDTGVAMFPTHDAIGPGDLAALVEERRHGSLWFPEHTHIPASRETPNPSGGELPRRYAHCYDLFVAMTAAVVATRRLRVCSGTASTTCRAGASSSASARGGTARRWPTTARTRSAASP